MGVLGRRVAWSTIALAFVLGLSATPLTNLPGLQSGRMDALHSGCGAPPPGSRCAAPRPVASAANWEDVNELIKGSVGTGPEMAYDVADGFVLIVGSQNTGSGSAIVTQEYSGATLTTVSPGLSPTAVGPLAYDASDGYPLMLVTSTEPAETWNFSHGSWHFLATASGPSGLSNLESNGWIGGLTYDPLGQRVLFVDGPRSDPSLLYTWAFHAGTWTNVSGSLPMPPALRAAGGYTIADDAGDGHVILWDADGNASATWNLSASGWVEDCSDCGPSSGVGTPNIEGQSATYDGADGYLLVFGGWEVPFGPYLNETWSFRAGSWSTLTPQSSPVPSQANQMVYDAADEVVLLVVGDWGYYEPNPENLWWYGTHLAPLFRVAVRIFPPNGGQVDIGTGPWGADGYITGGGYFGNGSTLIGTNGTYGLAAVPPGAGCPFDRGARGNCTGGWSEFENWSFSGGTIENGDLIISGAGGWLNLTFLPVVGITAQYTGCGPIDFGGTSLPDGTTATFPPGPRVYPLIASVCSAFSFQGWVATGGVIIGSSIASSTNATLSANATITAVYATVGTSGGPTIRSFTARPDPVRLGGPVDIYLFEAGATGPPTFLISGLPPGCPAIWTSANLNCTPTSEGSFTVNGTVGDSAAGFANATLTLFVEGTPGPVTIRAFTVSPSTVAPGGSVTLSTDAIGGYGYLSYRYTGLPPGCATRDSPSWSCSPSVLGRFSVHVVVTDSLAGEVQANASFEVETAVGHSAGSETELIELALIGGFGAAAIASGIVLFRRRDPRQPETSPPT